MHTKTAIVLSALLLAGCATKPIGSIAGGECNLPGVHTPPYVIKGKTTYDTRWSEDVTEGLVRGCGQERPKPRPASLDKPKHHRIARKPVSEAPAVARPATAPALETKPKEEAVTPKPVKKHWWQRFKKNSPPPPS